MRFLRILVLLFSYNTNFSQNLVKDSLSLEKISHVEIYSDKGGLIGVTDNDGFVSADLYAEVINSNSNILTFVHPTFKDKVITIETFKSNSVIVMNPIAVELKEVVINTLHKNYKYLKLKGYFRSIQIMQDIPLYYMDGIAEYYISIISNKVIVKIISSRSFENQESTKLDTKYFPIRAGVPSLESFFNYKVLSSEYNLKDDKKGDKIIFDKKEGVEKGFLSKFKENSLFQFELVSPNNPKKINFLGIEVQYNNRIVNAVYDTNDYSMISLYNLIYSKETMLFNYKIKKNMDLTKVDLTYEFFLLEKDFVDEKSSKESNSFYKFKKESNYQDNYWSKINNVFFKPLPESLEKYIEKHLKENK